MVYIHETSTKYSDLIYCEDDKEASFLFGTRNFNPLLFQAKNLLGRSAILQTTFGVEF